MLQFVPWGDDGLSLDLVRRHPDLENGVMELMIAELLAAAPRPRCAAGVLVELCRVSLVLGARRTHLASASFLRAWVRLLLVASRWWQIASLYRANAKFRPAWEPRFICFRLARDLGPIIGAALAVEGFLHWPRILDTVRTQLPAVGHAESHGQPAAGGCDLACGRRTATFGVVVAAQNQIRLVVGASPAGGGSRLSGVGHLGALSVGEQPVRLLHLLVGPAWGANRARRPSRPTRSPGQALAAFRY